VTEKCKIALAVSKGEAGGSYGEAVILISAVLGALAAEVWPGSKIDHKRFVELLVEFGPLSQSPKTISVPLLIQYLSEKSETQKASALTSGLLDFSETRVITGSEVDKSESELLANCRSLDLESLRTHSYANLFYKEVRSSYAHEYRPGKRADSWPMTASKDEAASYINRLTNTEPRAVERLIHFHVEWLAELAVGIAKRADELQATLPLPHPAHWWVEAKV
jgi:hypothetical protein